MPTTPGYSLEYPTGADLVDIATHFENLAESTESALNLKLNKAGGTLTGGLTGTTLSLSSTLAVSGATTLTGKVTIEDVGLYAGLELGTSGPRMMSGTGSPEGVVPAPVGSIWYQTDSTVGVTHWRKATGTGNTGWVVMEGDTGVRLLASWDSAGTVTGSMPAGLSPGAGYAGYVSLRRSNNTVMLQWYGCIISTVSAGHITFPTGFLPALQNSGNAYLNTLNAGSVFRGGNTAGVTLSPQGAGAREWWLSPVSVNDFLNSSVSYVTSEAWPTSLPGSAA